MQKAPKKELDSPWKSILDIYFRQFIQLCWPQYESEVDWSRGYKSLDKELQKMARNAQIGNRIADKLIELYLNNGQEAYILVHIEVQGDHDKFFEERMFTGRCRLREYHNKPIASLAILIDKSQSWRPTGYREALWESSIEMRFPIIKLLDFKNRISELENSTNPFSAVILAQLAVLEKGDPYSKLNNKVKLIRWLYGRGWKKDDILNILRFIDWVIALPPELEIECKKELELIEEELHVNYVTSWERIGIEKGIEQGIEKGIETGLHQGESVLLLSQLEHKFKEVPETYRQKIEQASNETLLQWAVNVLDCSQLEDVFKD